MIIEVAAELTRGVFVLPFLKQDQSFSRRLVDHTVGWTSRITRPTSAVRPASTPRGSADDDLRCADDSQNQKHT